MSDNIGFLFGDVSRLIRRTFDQRAKAIGVTRPQWRVLTALIRHESISQVALAEMLELDAMTLCRMIDRLEKSELIERRPNPDDRRAWQLFLTPNAKSLIEQLLPIGEELLKGALEGISERDQQKLYALLEQVRGNLSSIDEINREQNELIHAK